MRYLGGHDAQGREPARARSAFTRAISTMAPGAQQLPDLYIDRGRAYAFASLHAKQLLVLHTQGKQSVAV